MVWLPQSQIELRPGVLKKIKYCYLNCGEPFGHHLPLHLVTET